MVFFGQQCGEDSGQGEERGKDLPARHGELLEEIRGKSTHCGPVDRMRDEEMRMRQANATQ